MLIALTDMSTAASQLESPGSAPKVPAGQLTQSDAAWQDASVGIGKKKVPEQLE